MATPPVKGEDEFGPLLGSTLQGTHPGISHLPGLNTNKVCHLLDGPPYTIWVFFFFFFL